MRGGIAVLDFGGQYSHLICRRIRGLGVYAALMPYATSLSELKGEGVAGVVLSGGPASVYAEGAPLPDVSVLKGELPVLGICYGHQLIVRAAGGQVGRTETREYGRSVLRIVQQEGIFEGLGRESITVWMSHGDSATAMPPGFRRLASSDNSPYAAVASADGRRLGLQFHPEVAHTELGDAILSNFVFQVCGARKNWSMQGFVERSLSDLASLDGRVLCAVSGGVDSSVTAVMLSRSIGDSLSCVFIDTGLLREGEAATARENLESLGVKLDCLDESKRFLDALKGVVDPEEKRKAVGREFAEAFEEYARARGPFAYLAQGTLYPDVIESGRTDAPASVIKTHHNVGGLPKDLSMGVVEPLRELYKDEVREVGRILGLPRALVERHPFPGPGLSVRVIGEVTREKLRICRESNRIVEEALMEEALYGKVWQALAYVGDDMVTGVLGDERKLGHQVTVKVVESVDAMTADWFRMPPEVLERISAEITNRVDGVVSVAYSVSSKPPATIEPQ